VNIRLKFLTSHERPASIHRRTRRSPCEFNDTLAGERREERSSVSVTRLRDETLSRDSRRRATLPVSGGATTATRALAPTYTVNIRYAPARGSPGEQRRGGSRSSASVSLNGTNSRTASRDQAALFANPSYSRGKLGSRVTRARQRQGGARVEKRTCDREEIASGTLRQTERGDIEEKGGNGGDSAAGGMGEAGRGRRGGWQRTSA